ncbi:MAG TPA: hypothetical protein VFV38_28670 [Ktedonobacteraceae bacterium]|nr:hypothetical protein [Ktedonobacteraceae bacterium]
MTKEQALLSLTLLITLVALSIVSFALGLCVFGYANLLFAALHVLIVLIDAYA